MNLDDLNELGDVYENYVKEAISKAGNATKEQIHREMKSQKSEYETRVINRRPYLKKRSPIFLGHRESHTVDGGLPAQNSQIDSTFMVKSTLVERKDRPVIVIGGAKKQTYEKMFRDGKVLRERIRVGAVSSKTVYILHRMNTGIIAGDYPEKSMLSSLVIKNRHFMEWGENKANIAQYINHALQKITR